MRLQNCSTLCALALLTFAVCEARILRKRSGSSSVSMGSLSANDFAGIDMSGSGSTEKSEGLISEVVDLMEDLTTGTVVGTVDTMDDLMASIMSFMESIPIIGPMISGVMDEMEKGITGFEKLTNGFLSRILGGALPCTISLQYGTQCDGLEKNGGMGRVLYNAMLEIPLLPHQVADFMYFLIQTFMDPVTDVIFGGVKT